jgi:hypothetical protein
VPDLDPGVVDRCDALQIALRNGVEELFGELIELLGFHDRQRIT